MLSIKYQNPIPNFSSIRTQLHKHDYAVYLQNIQYLLDNNFFKKTVSVNQFRNPNSQN